MDSRTATYCSGICLQWSHVGFHPIDASTCFHYNIWEKLDHHLKFLLTGRTKGYYEAMTQSKQNSPSQLNPALRQLQILIGEWNVEVSHASFLPDPKATQTGRASFEWLDGAFLVFRDHSPPQSTSVIGRNESLDTYSMLYYDSRGVSRIYDMSFSGGVWKLWREDPDFFQRFEGKISDDGNSITGCWEIAADGTEWKHDFDITYTRSRP
jgi:hypothetical protein